ncbi:type III secretion system needle tip protein SctA [Providencia alcalifaciens]|uniref:type III secretion system needle tip protein SctA n=1 Tax=Providencia alcalifaciens TaxID=126385 RepID=UPI000446BE4D|nr:type III secretion system needle tip protein SctA [Providencia alcalifaciens]ETT04774.1 type III effector protein IpaD/SipD/SspD [Providencia alcalifaciens F90-2004]EUC94959.1 type III effector protein IpaD/SipD/SspD [Providencia alcalifaciens PAL-2]CAG9435502.1 Cell invasion protein SipD [Providencia alcalifaciens]CAG9435518.1 Cell invasion protein SipD [Providencia alcalifaciens]CAG9435519.1 Cell invasion protein SipD [Providencia alcalifaciens]
MFSISNTTTPRTSQLNPTEKSQTAVAPEVRAEAGSEKKEGGHHSVHLSALQYADSKVKQLLTLNGDRPTLETMNEKINERVLTRQHVEGALKSLASSNVVLAEEQKQQLQQGFGENLPKLSMLNGGGNTISGRAMMSDAELWEKISDSIGDINNSYLKMYESVVEGYTYFYQKFSEKILAKMGSWVQPGKDGNSVKLSASQIMDSLWGIINACEGNTPLDPSYVLLPPQSGDSTIETCSKDVAEMWATELGLPLSCVKEKNGGYIVIPDLTPLKTMLQELQNIGGYNGNGTHELDNAKYQAWQAGFKSQEENLKTTLQTLTQKYSNANSLYDNLVKVLSSTISSCLETAKSFLQG